MDSRNENNFTISIQETPLLHHNEPKQAKRRNLKNILFTTFLIFIILTTASITLISMSKIQKPKPFNHYLSNSHQNYCYLTSYPELCYDSLTSIFNTIVLQANPTPIFTAAIQVAINQLNNITFSKTYESSVNQPRLSGCRTWVHDSLSSLNESLRIIDSDIEWLTYEEMDSMKTWIMSAARNASNCLLGLEEIGAMETVGVEEVKRGVKKAMNFMVNSVGLLSGRAIILNDFYNPPIDYGDDNYYYYYFPYYEFDYGFLICLYCGLYLFLGLLYFLFWKSK